MNTRKAFTLIELLIVIAIIVMLSALVIPALQRSTAAQISTTGSKVAGMLEAARQTAIMKRTPVAVAVLTIDANSPQRITSLQWYPANPPTATTSGTWKQTTKWEALPSGILVDNNTPKASDDTNLKDTTAADLIPAFQASTSPKPSGLTYRLPALVYSGTSYDPVSAYPNANAGYGYVIFQADGSLYKDTSLDDKKNNAPVSPCVFQIVSGDLTAGGLVAYRGKNAVYADMPANYFRIVLSSDTGQPKILRPGE